MVCGLAAFAQLSAATPAPDSRLIRVWFDHDGTNITSLVSPWHAQGVPFSEKVFRASIDELADKGIDVVAFSPGNGAVPWWQSAKNDHWDWFVARTGKKPGAIGKYIQGGGDLVRVFVEQCRRHNISPVISLRLKDEHNIENLDSEWVPKFYYEHQAWRLDPSPRAVFGLRGLNWIYPEVPADKLAMLTELAENYDLDGVQLDFMRFFPYFDVAKTTPAQRLEVMTKFVRSVRELLDRTSKPGQRRILSVRVPNRVSEYENLGVDLGAWSEADLIDVVNVSPSYVSQVESDLARIRAWAPRVQLLYEITHAVARGPSPSWGRYGDDYPIRATTDTQYYTAANLAYARGATGISLFNFPYVRPAVSVAPNSIGGSPGREPPFHVLRNLREPEFLSTQSQHYWIPYWWKTGYHGRQFQLPQTFVVGTKKEFLLDVQKPLHMTEGARVRIRHAGSTPVLSATEPIPYVLGRPEIQWRAVLNGVELQPAAEKGEPFADPYRAFLGVAEDYSAWKVPTALIKNGVNVIGFELAHGPISEEFKVEVIWIDLSIPAEEPR